MADNQENSSTALGPSPDDYAAVELHNSLQALRQTAIEVYYSTPSQAAREDRLIELCEIRQRLQDMLAAVAEHSRYATHANNPCLSVGD